MMKGVIFDADGTLLDSMKIWEDAGEKYLDRRGITAEPGLGEILYPMSLEESSQYLKETYHLLESPGDIRQGVLDVIADFYSFEVQLKPGVKTFLHKLYEKNIPMVIATTGDEVLLERALERLEIRGYFKRIFTCSEFQTSKREPLIFQIAAEFLMENKVEDKKESTKSEKIQYKTISKENEKLKAETDDNAEMKKEQRKHIWVFEDTLYAAVTAAKAGFRVAAVEDDLCRRDKEQIKKTADYFLEDFCDFQGFWEFAALK